MEAGAKDTGIFEEDGSQREDEVGFVDLWNSFVGEEEMYMIYGLYISGKWDTDFADGQKRAVDSGSGNYLG